MIAKNEKTGKYGAVACRDKKEEKPEEKEPDKRVAQYMDYDIDNLVEIAQNTEAESFGDPKDVDIQQSIISFRHDSINKKILKLPDLAKNNKGQLARYILHICDSHNK